MSINILDHNYNINYTKYLNLSGKNLKEIPDSVFEFGMVKFK